MSKFQFIIYGIITIIAITAIIVEKLEERKLGEIHKVIKLKRTTAGKFMLILGLITAIPNIGNVVYELFNSNYALSLVVGDFSQILLGVFLILASQDQIKITDNSLVHKNVKVRKENLLDVSDLGGLIEIKYNFNGNLQFLKLEAKEEKNEEVVRYIKNHFSMA